MIKMKLVSALVVGVLALAAPAQAVVIDLIAKEFEKTLPGGALVKMWGFAEGSNACWNAANRMASAACTTPVATSPGPPITIPVSETDVTIRLVNLLSSAAGGENISLFIPSQHMPAPAGGPTWTDNTIGGGGTPGVRRVRSFGLEAQVDGGAQEYRWTSADSNVFRAGTYLYHSGTHPQLQVQMGLYGAITKDASALPKEAYAGIAYDNEVLILYGEIDSVLHAAVTEGRYGLTTGPTSTFDYHPQYYLVNGEPFTTKPAATISGPAVGERTLLRLLNAGFQTHSPTLLGIRMAIITEDGNVYPAVRDEYSALLPPLKTRDAILAPTVEGTYALYDGLLNLSSTKGTASGMLSFLQVGAGSLPDNTAPVANPDPLYSVDQNNVLEIAAPGVLGNDSDAEGNALTAVLGATNVSNGTLTLNADGSFVYTPTIGTSGIDSFTYKASDGVLESTEATATITVNFVANNAPVADDQSVTTGQQVIAAGNSEAVAITLTGSDADGDPLMFSVTGGPTDGILSGLAPALTYTPNLEFAGTDSFTFKVNDGTSDSLVDAVVDITVEENQAPIADVDGATTTVNTAVLINLVTNDTDADGDIIAATVVIVKTPNKGTVVNNGDGTVTYTPKFDYTGSDTFRYRVRDDDGALSTNPNGGVKTKVRVNITP